MKLQLSLQFPFKPQSLEADFTTVPVRQCTVGKRGAGYSWLVIMFDLLHRIYPPTNATFRYQTDRAGQPAAELHVSELTLEQNRPLLDQPKSSLP